MPFINRGAKAAELAPSERTESSPSLLLTLPPTLSAVVLINTINEVMDHYCSCLSASLLSLSITQRSIQSLNRGRSPEQEGSVSVVSITAPTNMFASSQDSPFVDIVPSSLSGEGIPNFLQSNVGAIPALAMERVSPLSPLPCTFPTILHPGVVGVLQQHLTDVRAFVKMVLALLRRNENVYAFVVQTTREEVIARWEQQKATEAIPVIEDINNEIIYCLFPVFDKIIDLLRGFVKSNGFAEESA
jgi:hypothetical protein